MENKQLTVKGLFAQENVQKKFSEMLGKKAQGFITSVLQIVSQNEMLSTADPNSILQAAAMAATLDLPINNNLGFAYIIPFKDNKTGKVLAQFQLGYRAYIQLGQRTGLFKTMSTAPIFEGQLIEENPLTGYVFDFTKKKSEKVIGYAAYFNLTLGFEKTLYMTVAEITAHALRFSQTYKKGFGLWKEDFGSMASKTVIKMLLSKYAPLSIEMQRAMVADQSVINDAETEDVSYVDHEPTQIEPENTSHADLSDLYEMKKEALTEEEKENAERIIKGLEVHSYGKLSNLLKSK